MKRTYTVVLEVPNEDKFREYARENNCLSDAELKGYDTFGFVVAELEWVTQSGIVVRNVDEVESSLIVDTVIEQIEKDFRIGDTTALEELLKYIPIQILIAYLPEF